MTPAVSVNLLRDTGVEGFTPVLGGIFDVEELCFFSMIAAQAFVASKYFAAMCLCRYLSLILHFTPVVFHLVIACSRLFFTFPS